MIILERILILTKSKLGNEKALAEGKIHNKFIEGMERNTPDKLLNYKEYNEKIKNIFAN